jgi:hypothetical protein
MAPRLLLFYKGKMKKPIVLVLALGLTLAPLTAMAERNNGQTGKDLCIDFTSAPVPYNQIAAQNFRIPMAGHCAGWFGFTPQFMSNSPSYGAGCTSSDGSHVVISFTTQLQGTVIQDENTLALPAVNGVFNGSSIEQQSIDIHDFPNPGDLILAGHPFTVPITAASCSTPTIP